MSESPGNESRGMARRFRTGLETPLAGRFFRETRLMFAPSPAYDVLVVACVVVGLGFVFWALRGGGIPVFGGGFRLILLGVAVVLAGLWAAASNERMYCDLAKGSYVRLEGQGLFKRWVSGSLAELDALVLLAEEQPLHSLGGRSVVYRLVLHWKDARQPLLVVERRASSLARGTAINSGAAPILAAGARYAKALGVAYYDNSYFHSPCPVPVL